MSLGLYMDVQVPLAITPGLRRRGVDVVTAQDDGGGRSPDVELLDRAGELGRFMFTMDDDFLAEATRRLRAGLPFATVIYIRQLEYNIGRCIEDLELIAKTAGPSEARNGIIYLPL